MNQTGDLISIKGDPAQGLDPVRFIGRDRKRIW